MVGLVLCKPSAYKDSCCEHIISMAVSYPEDSLVQPFSLSPSSYILSSPSSTLFPEPYRSGMNVLFMAGHSKVTYSQHLEQPESLSLLPFTAKRSSSDQD